MYGNWIAFLGKIYYGRIYNKSGLYKAKNSGLKALTIGEFYRRLFSRLIVKGGKK